MATRRPDPYQTLGVSPGASEAELRAAYRQLVQIHHPDHNGGSPASARRFEEIQDAYAQVRERRGSGAAPPPRAAGSAGTRGTGTRGTESRTSPPSGSEAPPDPRLAAMEREVREAYQARERARQAAREAAAASARRPTDEELGYVTTDDSLGKILADARTEFSERFAEAKGPVANRVASLLDELASKLNGEERPRD